MIMVIFCFPLRLFNKEGNLICWMNENRWWLENKAILDFKCTKNEFSIVDINNTRILELKMREDLIEVSGSMYLLGDIIQLLKDRIVFRNSRNMLVNNNFYRMDHAIIIKEKSFNALISGKKGILMQI